MKRLFLVVCIAGWAAIFASAAAGQPSFFSSRLEVQFRHQMLSRIALPDSHAALTSLLPHPADDDSPLRHGVLAPSSFILTSRPLRFYGLEQFELTTFDYAMQGIGSGLTTGLFLGAIGTSTGLFDEDGAWYLAGAMTALGAYFGLKSKPQNPAQRLRYRWTEE